MEEPTGNADAAAEQPEAEPVPTDGDEGVDLEAAYQQALEALESAEFEVGLAFEDLQSDRADVVDADVSDADAPDESPGEASDRPASEVDAPPASEEPRPAESSGETLAGHGASTPERPSPLAILEAALFVGGTALTTKRLIAMFGGEFDAAAIERFVDELNDRYREQRRPYEIAFGEGGYRLQIRTEFEDVRHRVFGLGPREIKLSQQALEVLSLVAYRQPVSREDVAERGGKSGVAMLRQLVRRELVEVERDADEEQTVRYRTTPRFLEVFGIAGLDELPRAVELELK